LSALSSTTTKCPAAGGDSDSTTDGMPEAAAKHRGPNAKQQQQGRYFVAHESPWQVASHGDRGRPGMLAARDASWALFPCGRGACMPPMCPCPCPSPSMPMSMSMSMCPCVAPWQSGRAEWPCGMAPLSQTRSQVAHCACVCPPRPPAASARSPTAQQPAGGVGAWAWAWAWACGRRGGRWGGRRRSRRDCSHGSAQPFALHCLCLPGSPSLLEVPPSPLPGLRRLSATIPARSCL
jgi:hypothetical protein